MDIGICRSWQETSTYCHRGAITVPVVAHGFREKRTCLNTPQCRKRVVLEMTRATLVVHLREIPYCARTFDDEDITRSSVSTTLSYDENPFRVPRKPKSRELGKEHARHV